MYPKMAARAERRGAADHRRLLESTSRSTRRHVRVLRDAGLVRSRRDGKMVMYALTETGRALVGAVVLDAVVAQA